MLLGASRLLPGAGRKPEVSAFTLICVSAGFWFLYCLIFSLTQNTRTHCRCTVCSQYSGSLRSEAGSKIYVSPSRSKTQAVTTYPVTDMPLTCPKHALSNMLTPPPPSPLTSHAPPLPLTCPLPPTHTVHYGFVRRRVAVLFLDKSLICFAVLAG